MIDVVLTDRCVRKLKRELRSAKSNEIGGVLAAEQVADGHFVVRDLSVQREGSPTRFVRDPVKARVFMRRFHLRMANQPERFNYLGEWHSHPSFLALPSVSDLVQMQALIEERDQASSFLVLMIVKLDRDGRLLGSSHAFRRRMSPVRVRLHAQDGTALREECLAISPSTWRAWSRFRG
jgi:proteasome lid subunit RPN8/RPN11